MDSRLRVRKAMGEEDIRVLEALAKDIWEQHYSSIIGSAQVSYMLQKFQSQSAIQKDINNGYIYYMATFDGGPCGYSAIKKDKTGIFLSKLYVKKGYRRKGIARAMLDKIEAYAKKIKSARIWLTCNKYNTASLDTYKRLGYTIIDTCVKDIGNGFVMDDYVLEKRLS